MSSEITLEGVQYISSKRAAEITGYSQDYIGQLARARKIVGKRVGGLWYIVSESLRKYNEAAEAYTPIPPSGEAPRSSQDSSIISFEGKNYVSAARAAKLTSYHQDYIGQLARGGKILSRQVGKRWYVDIDALIEHKKSKDALLGAVQSSSVGILKNEKVEPVGTTIVNPRDPYDVGLHYTYAAETSPLLPVIDEKKPEHISLEEASSVGENRIPIRVVRPEVVDTQKTTTISTRGTTVRSGRMAVLAIFSKLFPIIVVASIALLAYNFSPTEGSIQSLKMPSISEVSSKLSQGATDEVLNMVERLLSKEIRYTRE